MKNLCTISSTSGDSIRWYSETSADLTATAPRYVKNISPLSTFPTLEPTWTRNTSYVKKYGAECFISMEDIKSADIDVLARSLLRLTRAVAKQVDSRIWDVISESRSATNINAVASSGGFNEASYAGKNAETIASALQFISSFGYSIENPVLLVNSFDYASLVAWTYAKGAQSPSVGNQLVTDGSLTKFCGCRVVVDNNVTEDYAAVIIPQTAATWKEHTPLTSKTIEEAGIGSRVRVWEIGECLLTDPKAVTLITNTKA